MFYVVQFRDRHYTWAVIFPASEQEDIHRRIERYMAGNLPAIPAIEHVSTMGPINDVKGTVLMHVQFSLSPKG